MSRSRGPQLSSDGPKPYPFLRDSSAKAMCAAIAQRGMVIGSAELIVLVHGLDVCVYQLDLDSDTVRTIAVILEEEKVAPWLDPAQDALKERRVQ